jgi:hypothetical protein
VGLERGPLSLVSTNEELLEWKSFGSGLENRDYGRGDPLRWPRDTFYQLKLALTTPTRLRSLGGIVRLRTKTTEYVLHGQGCSRTQGVAICQYVIAGKRASRIKTKKLVRKIIL